MITALTERLLNELEKIPILCSVIIIAVVVAFVAAYRIIRSGKKQIKEHRIQSDFGEKNYRNEILSFLPEAEQLDFISLYHQLDELQSFVNQGEKQLELQKSETLDNIDKKIQDSQDQIKNKWNFQNGKMDFYYCICVHYASFTLADSIKREQENIRNIFVEYKEKCAQLAEQIEYLGMQIEASKGKRKHEYMEQHRANCKKHQRLSKLKSIFASKNALYLQKVKEQNIYTSECRKYIIKNFGAKGRGWGERLEERKADLIKKKI